MGRTLLLMTIAVIGVTFGDIYMARAMKSVGDIKISGVADFFGVVWRVVSLKNFWFAMTGMATFFFIWTSILSYADLTFVLPLTAGTYILNAFLAGPMLNEHVSATRWAGVLMISLGVAFVTYSEATQKMISK